MTDANDDADTAAPAPIRTAAQEAIAASLAEHRPMLEELALALHADPEIAFAETRAAARLTGTLSEHGFDVEHGTGGLATAFRARCEDPALDGGEPLLTAVLCLEYDALPGVGHGCGHHLIAGAGLGAALALAPNLEGTGLRLDVIGTPAEEHGGGKQLLLEAGAFDGADLALMMHAVAETGTYDPRGSGTTAVGRWRVTFTGRAAHAAAEPSAGINAEDAATVLRVAAGLLRQRMRDGQRMAIVQGEMPEQLVTNIIPDRATVDMECRALTIPEFAQLRDRLIAAAEGAALATGCTVAIEPTEPVYEPLVQDETLAEAWNDAMRLLSRPLRGSTGVLAASTDMGNVSQRLPGLHPFVGIPGVHAPLHTREFAAASTGAEALALMHDGATAMAWMIHGIVTDPERRVRIRERARTLRAEHSASGSQGRGTGETPHHDN